MPTRIPRPSAVLFDLFDTLVPAMRSDHPLLTPTWEDLGITVEAYQQRWSQNHDGRAIGRIQDPVEVLRIVTHDIDPTIPIARIAWAAERRVRRFEYMLSNVNPNTVAALARLKAASVPVALVSNACVGEIETWPTSPFAPHFDTAIFSCHVGFAKPDRRIYEMALARIDVTAQGAILVGDGGSDEHRGAREVGLRTALISGLADGFWTQAMAERRTHVDWEFTDAAAFVAAIDL